MKIKRKPRGSLSSRKSSTRNPHQIYDRLKSMLSADLTPKEYAAACVRIARELGI